MVKEFGKLLWILSLCLMAVSSALAQAENLDMFIGEVVIVGKVEVDRVAIGNGSIIKAEILSTKELLLIGENAGSTSLRLWNKDGTQYQYNIRVSEKDPEKRVRMESMIRIRVKMVEMRKSALSKLGIDWSREANGPAFATAGDFISNTIYRPAESTINGATLPLSTKPMTSYFGIASSLTSKINLMASDGDAVILSEPVLSCVNGGTAKFISGGEYPIPITNKNGGTSVEFKQYGIKMDISPKADQFNHIYTTIKAEVSEIDQATSVFGVPGILKNETQTMVNANSGQTIVISGLLKAKRGKTNSRIPGLGDMPLIGGLFGSDDKLSEMSETVVFLTPEVVTVEDAYDDAAQRLEAQSQQTKKYLKQHLEYDLMD
ncbi:MAG: pilus assembly protein N-terminal domain-containing protein [Candidatus Thiodiazotropha sp.]